MKKLLIILAIASLSAGYAGAQSNDISMDALLVNLLPQQEITLMAIWKPFTWVAKLKAFTNAMMV